MRANFLRYDRSALIVVEHVAEGIYYAEEWKIPKTGKPKMRCRYPAPLSTIDEYRQNNTWLEITDVVADQIRPPKEG